MSVYSGFAARQQESRYNQCLQYTLCILVKRLTSFYLTEECNESKFQASLRAVCSKMEKLQENKHMLPHYSHILTTFMNSVSQHITALSQLSRVRGEQSFHQGFNNIDRKKHKAQFNSIEQDMQCEELKDELIYPNHLSHSTLKFQQRHFAKRTKTVTPDKKEKCMSFTPGNFHNKNEQQMFQKNMKQHLEECENSRSQTKIKLLQQTRDVKKITTDFNLNKTRPLSPRQFLRQTIQGKQFTGKQGYRTKVRHQRIV